MKRTILILLGIFLFCILIYFLLLQKEHKTFAPSTVENFLALDSARVDQIEFKKFDTRMSFQKVGPGWFMTEPDSFRADKDELGQLLNITSHLEVGEVISSNPEKQGYFMVDDFTGTTISFFSGKNKLTSLVVGKISKDLLHTYLRKTNSNDVFLASVLLARMTERGVAEWKDRGIFDIESNQVKEIEFSQKSGNFKLTRSDTLWGLNLMPDGKSTTPDYRLVNDYLFTLSSIKGDEWASKPEIEQLDFTKSEFTITITFLDGHRENLFIVQLQPGSDRYYAKTDQGSNVLMLYEYTFKRIAKIPDDFNPK